MQNADDIHLVFVLDLVEFPIRFLAGSILATNANVDELGTVLNRRFEGDHESVLINDGELRW